VTICHATGSSTNPYRLIEISVNGLNGHEGHAGDIIPAPADGCPMMVVTTTPPAPGTLVQVEPIPCAELVDVNGMPVIGTADCQPDTTVITPPAWTPVALEAAVCTDWLVYHTNRTGDWELFRLDSVPSTFELNLSRGVGLGVVDIAPSRSPDAQWIVFSSNRDGNFEIYLSAVESDRLQRVTYNTTAIELDPVWSPTGTQLVYESNRDGNWNLYMFDVTTGIETRLTDSNGNDVNASWSYDGTSLVFQSDRTGVWQIFEYTFDGAWTWQLSNETGDDHNPQYTVDNTGIIFRSFRNSETSVIYRMNRDGSTIVALSDPVGYAMDAAVSPLGNFVAYTSNLDGDQDIYIFEFASGLTRQVTDSLENDYAPTWYCGEQTVAFTSDVTTNPDLFSASALPIDAPPVVVMGGAIQLTTDPANDQYPMLAPAEENASRNESVPSPLKNR
jgi:TolB protein